MMNVALPPAVVEIRRSRLLGLVVAAVALGAASTWGLTLATGTRSDHFQSNVEAVTRDVSSAQAVLAQLNPSARKYVEGIMTMTHAELVAAYGTGPVVLSGPTTRDVSSAQAVLAQLNPSARKYVEGIMAMSHAELVAAFGR
jgi:hypothetical protein